MGGGVFGPGGLGVCVFVELGLVVRLGRGGGRGLEFEDEEEEFWSWRR